MRIIRNSYNIKKFIPFIIPGCKVDISRVTHPSATHTIAYAFDLHVLGLSLAFTLSQDQTLVYCSYILFYFAD